MNAAISAREAEVLDLLGRHLTHAEIAARLVVSIRTVESHVASLRRKLDIPGHRELVRYAAAQRGRPTAPVELSSFVGRVRERAELADAVLGTRLVTVIGTGGVGKTRLARVVASELAAQFPAGVWFADLVPVQDDGALPAAVAAAYGTADVPGRDSVDALVRGIGTGRGLLVLDNCEHLTNGVAGLVERLLTRCPHLHVLVTSRARLALPSERVFALDGLSADGDALALFVDRATSAGWGRPSAGQLARMAAICTALDGIALAIELAAVRLPSLGLDGLAAGLGNDYTVLAGGPRATARHRSMHDTIDWSYRLLAPPDRTVLRRAAVFASGFDVTAASEVIGFGTVAAEDVASALGRLADQSLVAPVTGAVDRRWRLLEPIRQFAHAHADDGDRGARPAHLAWVGRRLGGVLDVSRLPDREWYDVLDDIADDARVAIAWAAAQPRRHAEAAELAARLATVLFRSGRMREAQRRWEQAAELSAGTPAVLDHLHAAAAVAKCRVDGEVAHRLESAAIVAARELDDPQLVSSALDRAAATVLRFRGMFTTPPPVSTALAMLDEAGTSNLLDPRVQVDPLDALDAARSGGDRLLVSVALDAVTVDLVIGGRPVDAARFAVERVRLFGRDALDPQTALELKDALHMAVLASLGAGDLVAAQKYARRQGELAFLREQRHVAIDEALAPAALAGQWDELDAAAASWLADWVAAGRPPASGRAISAAAVAMAHGLRRNDEARERWLSVVADLRGVHPDDAMAGTGYGAVFDAIVDLDRDQPAQALDRLRSESDPGLWYGRLFCQWKAALLASAAVRAGDRQADELFAGAEVAARGNPVAERILGELSSRRCST